MSIKKIGLDIDDTITNTHVVLMKYAIKYNMEHENKPLIKYNTNNFGEAFNWSDEEVENFFRTYYLDALNEIEPKANAKEVLTKLKSEGYEIIFVTIRNDRECGGENEAKRITLEWLNKYDIPFNELHVGIFDKKKFCLENSIDVFMDDSINTINNIKDTNIKTLLAMNIYNNDYQDDNVTNIYSMDELYNVIHELDNN